MICKNCNSEMIKDDTDIISKGNYDKYWICGNCLSSCIEIFRHGCIEKVIWDEND